MNHPVLIKKLSLYTTYQIVLELHPTGSSSVNDVFRKSILYVTDWLKEKHGEEIPEELARFPDVDNFGNLQTDEIPEIRLKTPSDLRTFFWKDVWTVRFTENIDRFSGEFISNISIERKDGLVSFAVRTECRQLTDAEKALGYRPAYLKKMAMDESFVITEPGIPKEYPVSQHPIMINGKSGSDLDAFYNTFLNHPKRSLPILFYPEPQNDEQKKLLDGISKLVLGYYYAVVVTTTVNKLNFRYPVVSPYMDTIDEGKAVIYRTAPAVEGCDPSVNTDHIFAIEENLYDALSEVMVKEGLKRECDFSEIRFNSDLWNTYNDERIHTASESGNDQDLIRALQLSNQEAREQIAQNQNDLNSSRERIRSLEAELEKKDKALLQEIRDHQSTEKKREAQRLDNINETTRAENEVQLLQSRLNAMSDVFRYSSQMARAIINAMPLIGEKNDAENYIKWVEHFYGETILLHENAIRSIRNDAEKQRNWTTICWATHFIAGVTGYLRNPGITVEKATEQAQALYDPENFNFSVTRSLTGETKKRYLSDYQINIQSYHDTIDARYEKVPLEYHLRYDPTDRNPFFRIYLYYDAELEKSIIGYMPGHLPTAGFNG